LYSERSGIKKKGGKKNKPGPVKVDHNFLASNYYGAIVAGLSLISDLQQAFGWYYVFFLVN